jgi:MYXO-CTERM domain-containing protein
MAVPEPTPALGFAAGVAGFVALAGWRRRLTPNRDAKLLSVSLL